MALHVGLYSPWNTDDPRAWSGVVAPMAAALRERFDITVFPPVTQPDATGERLRTRLRGLRGQRSLPTHTMATARLRSAALADQIRTHTGEPLDALVAIAASTDVLSLPHDLPLIQITDATFPAICGFYPIATGLGRRNEREGLRVEQAGAAVTDHFLVASDWAARSLTDVVGVAPNRVTVAPFGPGTPPPVDVQPRNPGTTLRVLAVIADWERKRGEDVVAAAERARRSRDLTLTIVGRAPEGLPSWVNAPGVVDRARLTQLYRDNDVLVDLARANAAGVVMTDALASGLPVIATRVGGVESIIQDRETGWLVDADRSADQAGELLLRLTPGQVAAASAAALRDANHRLTWEAWANAVVAAVQSTVKDRRPLDGAVPPPRQRRAVMITPVLPSDRGQEAAGEKLVREVVDFLTRRFDVTLLSALGPANERAIARGGLPPYLALQSGRHLFSPVLNRLGLGPVLGPKDVISCRSVIEAADIIDIQWQENGILVPLLRRINPRARIVVTLHDVLSQRFGRHRDQQIHPARQAVWEVRRRASLAVERLILATADDVVVLSEKDAALLPTGAARARVHVVPPAIPGSLRSARGDLSPRPDPLLLFVGFMARWPNEEGMRWFVTEVLPLVRYELPGARMAVAGGGLRDHVVAELQASDVDVLGFVDDLDGLYEQADLVVVPLLSGAGVKFKVVEALVRGVPVVTTSVGNEGIHPADAAHVADDPAGFAAHVVRMLRDPASAERHARMAAPRAAEEFGLPRFHLHLDKVYQ
ncbi:glycosyltransferase [Micrococcus luteus]|uniref:glycosyltransferase n=1 Tax=Micrococcus luteus TaxID=1270 RepID=UPI000D504A20|nr:glycosyltransferase [Micrococcus luteus]AWD24614.1 glycosyltransferase [Micrococcus luteus]